MTNSIRTDQSNISDDGSPDPPVRTRVVSALQSRVDMLQKTLCFKTKIGTAAKIKSPQASPQTSMMVKGGPNMFGGRAAAAVQRTASSLKIATPNEESNVIHLPRPTMVLRPAGTPPIRRNIRKELDQNKYAGLAKMLSVKISKSLFESTFVARLYNFTNSNYYCRCSCQKFDFQQRSRKPVTKEQ